MATASSLDTSPAGTAAQDAKPEGTPRKPEWAPRIWEGCDFFAWFRLVWRNRFRVHPAYWYIAVIVTFVSLFHTFMRFWQEVWYGRRVRRAVIEQPPIFIIGHWRTGTTLLHEFLTLDERHAYPTTYECLAPHDFLLTEGLFTRFLSFLAPSHRPMDNMKAGFDRPQEDEFALCMMGEGSPYLTIAFPNHPPQCQEYLDLEGLPPRKLARWKKAFYRFLQRVTFKNPRRLVLKSPPHTARLKVLSELFPNAIFVHIVRDPYIVFPSTVNLWKTLYRTHGLQKPTFAGLEEYVYTTYLRLYDKLEETRHLVDPARFHELRYEDLIRDPVGQMRAVYEHLQLGDFDSYRPRLEKYLASIKGYETNKYQVTPQQRREITLRWGHVIERYGYGQAQPEGEM